MLPRPRLPADTRPRPPRLADAFRTDPRVVAVYLFGSVARGTEGPLSDVDVAILLAEPIDAADASGLAVEYTTAVLGTLGTDEASVVLLNTAPLARAIGCSGMVACSWTARHSGAKTSRHAARVSISTSSPSSRPTTVSRCAGSGSPTA
jgi:predicted nucleotidyltransferase